MKTISLREFQLRASIYISDLPIVLTVYGKPVAKVSTLSEEENVSTQNVSTAVNTSKSVDTPVEQKEVQPEETYPTTHSTVIGISKEQQVGKKARLDKAKKAIAHIQPKKVESPKVLDWDKPERLPGKCGVCNRLLEGVQQVQYFDADGTPSDPVWMCEKDLKRLELHRKNAGGTIQFLNQKPL